MQIRLHRIHPVPTRGASAIVTNVGRGAVDAEAATDECGLSVRQRRVVLTSRCWRQVLKKLTLLRGDGGKRAVLRGDHVISRKAIAQGVSDVLRCPVCSCAHYSCNLAHGTAGAARILLSMRPLVVFEGGQTMHSSGAWRRENADVYPLAVSFESY